jgi:hypothetical protein
VRGAEKVSSTLSERLTLCSKEKKELEDSLERARQRGTLTGTQEAFGKEFLATVDTLLKL